MYVWDKPNRKAKIIQLINGVNFLLAVSMIAYWYNNVSKNGPTIIIQTTCSVMEEPKLFLKSSEIVLFRRMGNKRKKER